MPEGSRIEEQAISKSRYQKKKKKPTKILNSNKYDLDLEFPFHIKF